jgi:hypothetical protein
MSYNLFLDDKRTPQKHLTYLLGINGFGNLYTELEWVIVKSFDEFLVTITERGLPDRISFDHDLGNSNDIVLPDGNDCCKWLIEYCLNNNLPFNTECKYHSANPEGITNMQNKMNNLRKFTNL